MKNSVGVKPLEILSFGAGVQSTTLLYLALRGEHGLPKLDHVIFADVGWEPQEVYDHLEACKTLCEEHGVAFHTVVHRNLKDDIIGAADRQVKGEKGGRLASFTPPFYVRPKEVIDGVETLGELGMLRRFCTSIYKVAPVDKKINEIRREWAASRGLKAKPANYPDVKVWLGISLDEIQRMKSSTKGWMEYRHPLAWDLRWTRQHCLQWFEKSGLPKPPRSACLGCPYHSNKEWQKLRDHDPEGWQETLVLDRYIRNRTNNNSVLYLHRSGVPLDEAVIDEPENPEGLLFGFLDECSGMCGL